MSLDQDDIKIWFLNNPALAKLNPELSGTAQKSPVVPVKEIKRLEPPITPPLAKQRPKRTTVKKIKVLEKDFQKAVIELAQLLGWRVAHFRAARAGKDGERWATPVAADGKGFPDLMMVRERVIYAELKSETGVLSAEQKEWRDWLRAAGQAWFCWRPSMWNILRDVLERKIT